MRKQKLELTWVGKNEKMNIESRILIENPEYSYGDKKTENMIIHGDNLLALKSLQQEYAGKIKCIYIDPPYNTGAAFENYDDNLEHSIWLNLMRARIELLKNLLSNDGFFCCQIDDSEGHYLKVLLDEIFGRNNYISTIYVRVRYPEKTLKSDMDFHKEIEQIHIYRKEHGVKPNLKEEISGFEKFCYFIKEIGKGREITLGGKKVEIFSKENFKIIEKEGDEYGLKEIWASGTILDGNSSGRFFRDYLTGRVETDDYGVLYKVYGIGDDRYDYRYFTGPKRIGATKGKYYQGVPNNKLDLKEMTRKLPINNFYDFAGNFGNCRLEGDVAFRGGKKPENLLEMLLNYFSNENDFILDSFLGSGTTVAVAHKMNRKYIGVEMGEHAYSLVVPRMKKVVDGEQGGISKSANWTGGGGFKFYELAPSLLEKDKFGNLVISKKYDSNMLAMAMAKHEGYTYMPHKTLVWKQGFSGENNYIYTTTEIITIEYLNYLASELSLKENLLVCAKSFDKSCVELHPNITVKQIPKILFGKCEFGKNDYKLNVKEVENHEEHEEE